jgi:hypothetical protein
VGLARKGQNMSEQEKPKSYLQELNQWISDQVVDPLTNGDAPDDPDGRSHDEILDDVYQAIRGKVLESYHMLRRKLADLALAAIAVTAAGVLGLLTHWR